MRGSRSTIAVSGMPSSSASSSSMSLMSSRSSFESYCALGLAEVAVSSVWWFVVVDQPVQYVNDLVS
jgi:hypothetical protein